MSTSNERGYIMAFFGYSLEMIYLFGLIVGGVLTLFYILFGDLLEGIFEVISEGPVNPILVLSFITIFSSMAYILEKFMTLNSLLVFISSIVTAFIFVTLLNIFVLVPLSRAEATLAYSDEDLKGRVGKVITSIPLEGFGEVIIEGKGGNIAKSAVSFEEEAIAYGEQVLVIDIENGVLKVTKHENLD